MRIFACLCLLQTCGLYMAPVLEGGVVYRSLVNALSVGVCNGPFARIPQIEQSSGVS